MTEPPGIIVAMAQNVPLLKTGVTAFLLFVLFFLDSSLQSAPGFVGSALLQISAILLDAEMQWMVFLCLAAYFSIFIFLRTVSEISLTQRREGAKTGLWLAATLMISAGLYTVHYCPSSPALTLLAGAVLGQSMRCWTERASCRPQSSIHRRFVYIILLILILAAVWHDDAELAYAYRSHTRWTGPWDNPNIFGLLMGTGVVLAIGRVMALFGGSRDAEIQISKSVMAEDASAVSCWQKHGAGLLAVWLLGSAMLMACGLLHSYSRGAWLAAGGGLTILIGARIWRLESRGNRQLNNPRWFQKNWLPLTLILMAVGAICLWSFGKTDWHPVRRALSVVNSADFSSRNRVAAWVGDLQIMAEHPWLGTGWNQPEPLYQYYYLPPKLTESAAIQMNDYLMLGATLGIPALICFAMYLGLSLMQN